MKKQTVQARIIEIEEKTWAVHNPSINRVNGGAMSSGNTVFLVTFEFETQEIMTFSVPEGVGQFFSVGQEGKLTYRNRHFVRFVNHSQEEESPDSVRNAFLFILLGAAVILALSVMIFSIYTLALRSSYRKTVQEINQTVLDADYREVTATHNGVTVKADKLFVQQFNSVLSDQNTRAKNREAVYNHGDLIGFDFGSGILEFCHADDKGTAINIHWQTEDQDKYYTVRSEVSYKQLEKMWKDYMIEVQRWEKK